MQHKPKGKVELSCGTALEFSAGCAALRNLRKYLFLHPEDKSVSMYFAPVFKFTASKVWRPIIVCLRVTAGFI